MASNPYFSFYEQNNEQNLMDDLVVESIRQFAHDLTYLPRDIDVNDDIMNEPIIQSYSNALDVEMYIKSWDNYQGEGQLLAKFGLEIRDQITFILTKRSFEQFIKPTSKKERPWEGDCIFIPMFGNVYQIKYVSSADAAFFMLGKGYAWEITAELLEFSNEQFKTGRDEIDDLNPPFEHADDPDYDLDEYDTNSQNSKIQDESDQIIDWSERSPFGEV